MALKRNEVVVENNATQPNDEEHEPFEFRENPRYNAIIDAFIKQNPKPWAFIKSMSRERLERRLVLEKVRATDLRQKLDEGVVRKAELNPDFKKDCEAVLKHFPEDERGKAKIKMARDYVFSQSHKQKQGYKISV